MQPTARRVHSIGCSSRPWWACDAGEHGSVDVAVLDRDGPADRVGAQEELVSDDDAALSLVPGCCTPGRRSRGGERSTGLSSSATSAVVARPGSISRVDRALSTTVTEVELEVAGDDCARALCGRPA